MNCTAFEEASLSRKLKSEYQDVRKTLAAKEVTPPSKQMYFSHLLFNVQRSFAVMLNKVLHFQQKKS